MAKEMKLRDLLTKLSYVFPDDCYIYSHKFVLEGEKSAKRNCSSNAVFLSSEAIALLNQTFTDSKIIFFSNIKKAKDDLDHYISFPKDEELEEKLKKDLEQLINKNLKAENWKTFDISKEEIEEIFSQGKEFVYEIEEGKEIILSKSILPIVTAKTFSDLLYRYETFCVDEPTVVTWVVLRYDFKFFQYYINFYYLL